MRPIEKRIAAVEARSMSAIGNGSFRVFFRPAGVDPEAFRRECEAEANSANFYVVVFVGKQPDGTWDL